MAWAASRGSIPSAAATFPNGVRGRQDLTAQALVDLLERPGDSRSVLGPFEVADDHAARIAQDVREDVDAVGTEDGVGVRRNRSVGRLGEDPRPNGVGICRRDLPLERREDEDVDIQPEQLLVVDRPRPGRPGDRAVLTPDGVGGTGRRAPRIARRRRARQ